MEILKIVYSEQPDAPSPVNDQEIYTNEPIIVEPNIDLNGNTCQLIKFGKYKVYFVGSLVQLRDQLIADKLTI